MPKTNYDDLNLWLSPNKMDDLYLKQSKRRLLDNPNSPLSNPRIIIDKENGKFIPEIAPQSINNTERALLYTHFDFEKKRTYSAYPEKAYNVNLGNPRNDAWLKRELRLRRELEVLRLQPEELADHLLENQRTFIAMPLGRETELPLREAELLRTKQPTTKKMSMVKKIGQKFFSRKETDGKPESLKAGKRVFKLWLEK
jgi:hypothetical protein